MAYNTKVVEPLRAKLADSTVDQLLNALALVWGTEAVLVLEACAGSTPNKPRTRCCAPRDEMLDGFLAEHPPRTRGRPPQSRGPRRNNSKA
jgi:hypothetical protein